MQQLKSAQGMSYANTDSTPPASSANRVVPRSNSASTTDHMRSQLEWQSEKLRMLEHENLNNRQQVAALQHELDNRPAKISIPTPPNDGAKRRPAREYKKKYTRLLPSKIQTNLLVDFYLQNIDYIYHPLHHPTFKKSLIELWESEEDVDIGWLGTLLMVLGLAAIHLPKGLINIDSKEIEKSHNIWFEASKECINIADSLRNSSSEFNMYMLQWFSLCQLYFYATRRAEQLNDILAKAIRDAHAMELNNDDKDNPDLLELEMKRRLWWDICGCDTFRALSLGTKPEIRSYCSVVPFPSNCNDTDLTPDAIKVHSSIQPTDNSFNVHRALMMKIMNGMFEKKHQVHARDLKSLEKVTDKTFRGLLEVDIELCRSKKSLFFELNTEGTLPHTLDSRIHFQHHMLHTCICIHRFRIYQNFLEERIPVALEVARTTARSIFSVYKQLRTIYDLRNPLFLPQIHQSFTGSIIQSMMLLVNQDLTLEDQTALYEDIDLMLNDLQVLSEDGFILKPEVLKESFKVLNVLKKSINKSLIELERDQKDIVSNVFGGKDMTESYLKKCTVSFIIDHNDQLGTETRKKQEQQEQSQQEKQNLQNQIGVMIDNSILEKSLEKFSEIDLKRFQEQHSAMQRKPLIVPPRAANPSGIALANGYGQLSAVSDDASQAFPNFAPQQDQQLSHVQTSPHTHQLQLQDRQTQEQPENEDQCDERNKIAATPVELNFNDVDRFWTDMGQQGLDALNNMYYSEFSGYKIS